MGNLVKSHLARLVVLSAAAYQFAAALESFFWPKIFWDFFTDTLDNFIQPFPLLQCINVAIAIVFIAWEWPLSLIAGTSIHQSVKARLIVLPWAALAALSLYQATNSAIYYMIGFALYFLAHDEGEYVGAQPWTMPLP